MNHYKTKSVHFLGLMNSATKYWLAYNANVRCRVLSLLQTRAWPWEDLSTACKSSWMETLDALAELDHSESSKMSSKLRYLFWGAKP